MNYNNAPIVEAIFDIRVNNTEIEDVNAIEELKNTLLKDFPITNKRINFEGKIELNVNSADIKSKGISNITGFIFSNKEKNRKIQFRTDGYTCNFLAPYNDWEEFSDLALEYWNIYLEFAKPKIILRIALRYINKIEIPLGDNFEFETYLKSVPQIPKSLPQKFNEYFLRMRIPSKDKNIEAIVSQTFEKPVSNFLPFIIDIDVYNSNLTQAQEDLSNNFNELRKLKNIVFEDLITDETRNLFK